MTPQQVQTIVESELLADPGATDVRASLVIPRLQDFILVDTYEQMSSPEKRVVSYWVVAESKFYCVFYDPECRDFGLADPPRAGAIPQTSGVRGDLISTFRAM